MAKLTDAKRSAIAADLRRGMPQTKAAEKHGVSTRTVRTISKAAPPARSGESAALLDRLDRLAMASEKAMELAEASDDSREMSAAIRASNDALKTVARMRADIEREAEGGTLGEIEAVKGIIIEELKDHPEVRKRVAARLLALAEKS